MFSLFLGKHCMFSGSILISYNRKQKYGIISWSSFHWGNCLEVYCDLCYFLSPVQALGCILYLLCFKQHPFEEGAKLQIVNGKYSIPQNDVKYTVYHDLIRTYLFVLCLLVPAHLSVYSSILLVSSGLADWHSCHCSAASTLLQLI